MSPTWKNPNTHLESNITTNKSPWKKKRFWIVLLCFLIFLIATLFLFLKNRRNQSENKTKNIKTAQAERNTISEDIDGSGVLDAGDIVAIKIPVGIVIEKIYVESGDKVEKGASLAKIKEASILSALIEIESSLDSISDKLDDDDDLTDLEIEQLKLQKSELTEAKSQMNQWKANPVIKASCAGIVGEINVSEGNETKQTSSSNSSTSNTAYATYQSYAENKSSTATKMIASLTPTTGMITYTNNVSANPTLTPLSMLESSADENTEITTETTAETTTESTTETTAEPTTETTAEPTTEATGTTTESSAPTTSTATKKESTTAPTSRGNQSQQTKGMQNIPSASSQTSKSTGTNDTINAATTGNASSDIYSSYEMCGFTILSLDTAKLSISIDELDILSVKEGQTATITFDAMEEETHEGTITKVAQTSSSSSGNSKYNVDIELPMTENMLLGMTASATIHINQAENVLTIPMIALQQKGNTTYVYTKSDENGNLDGMVEVETGLSDGSNVEIKSGLAEGDTVYYTRSGNSDSDREFSFGENRMRNDQNMSNDMPNGMPNGGQRPDRSNGGFPPGSNQ